MSAAEKMEPQLVKLAQAVDALNDQKFEDVLRAYNIRPMEPLPQPTWATIEYRRDGIVALAGPDTQDTIGAPGTRVVDGRIEVEHNFRLRPYQSRGRLSNPGSNEEIYRTDPVVFKSVNEIAALICGATYEPVLPDSLPARVRKEAERQHRAIMRAVRRDEVLLNASTFLKHGFALFEVRWHQKDQSPACIEFREQSTVNRWLFDERQVDWLGTEFRTGGQNPLHYVIPNGETLSTARSMLVNLHASGNNLEGVSPVRVVTGLRKLKELILQAFGISYQKYAVPIAFILRESLEASAGILNQASTGAHAGEIQALIDRLQNLRSRLGAVLPVPEGHRVEYVNPSNQMPDPKPLLEYIDTMIAMTFANEGALLGSQSFGSYAMAAKSDEKFMRAAPAYAERIASAFTRLLHTSLKINLGDDLFEVEELPHYAFRFNGTQDASRYLSDLTLTMNSVRSSWPKDARVAAAAKLGLPADAFAEMESDAPVVVGEGVEQGDGDVQKTALNGAQVTSMVEVLTQVASGQLPAESAVRILMRAFQMSREEAEAMVNPAEGFEQESTEPEFSGADTPVRFGNGEEE